MTHILQEPQPGSGTGVPNVPSPLRVDALADFLRAYPGTRRAGSNWTHFANLTFAYDVPEARAMTALRWWLRALAMHCQGHVPYAFALGYQTNHRLHFHVLLAVAMKAPITVNWLDHYWRLSDPVAHFARVNTYDSSQGAVRYIAAHNGKCDLNVACPRNPRCRRQNGCQEAPTSWR